MLTSNLGLIIGRLERIAPAIQTAAAKATSPVYWKPRLESVAERTLRAQWALERDVALRALYEQLSPRIVASLTAELLAGPITRFTLGNGQGSTESRPTGASLSGAMTANMEGRTAGGKVSKNYRLPPEQMSARAENLQAVREAILDWVQNEKRKETAPGGRDAGLSDAEIAERIEWILGVHPRSTPDRTGAMEAAAQSLLPVVQDFVNRTAGGERRSGQRAVDPAVIQGWLAAVLAAWQAVLMASLPSKLKFEVERELGKIKGALI